MGYTRPTIEGQIVQMEHLQRRDETRFGKTA